MCPVTDWIAGIKHFCRWRTVSGRGRPTWMICVMWRGEADLLAQSWKKLRQCVYTYGYFLYTKFLPLGRRCLLDNTKSGLRNFKKLRTGQSSEGVATITPLKSSSSSWWFLVSSSTFVTFSPSVFLGNFFWSQRGESFHGGSFVCHVLDSGQDDLGYVNLSVFIRVIHTRSSVPQFGSRPDVT